MEDPLSRFPDRRTARRPLFPYRSTRLLHPYVAVVAARDLGYYVPAFLFDIPL